MTLEKTFVTKEGLVELEKEQANLIHVVRKEVIEDLQAARAQGDLSENADYDAARDKQAEIEGRVKEIEGILKNYTIIKEDTSKIVNIGKTVILKIGELPKKEYTIVGSLEANPRLAKISNESPIGKGIIGSTKGDKLSIKTETGAEINVTVVDVK